MEVYLTPGQAYRIGRAPDNQIVVPDPTISRYHATVRALTDRVVLQDLDSKNGTFVNGRRIQGAVEVFGVEDLRLGRVVFLLDRVPTSAVVSPDRMATPSAQDAAALYADLLQGLQADRQIAEDLYDEWYASAREDPERALRKTLQVCMRQGFLHRVAVLRSGEGDRPVVLLDTAPDPPPSDLQEWALQTAAAGPRIQWRPTDPPQGVLAFPLTSRSAALLWTETTRLASPAFRSLLPLVFWLLRWWEAYGTIPRPIVAYMGAWAPFPFWGFSVPVYRLIRYALAVAPLTTPVAVVGPPGSGKTTLARWLHELGRPQGTFRVWDVSRSDDPYSVSLHRPEGPDARLWWPLHRGTVAIRGIHACAPDVQERLADWIGDPRVTVEGVDQRLDIRWVFIGESDPRRTPPGCRPLPDRLIDLFSAHVLQVPALAERREDLPYLANYLVQQISQGRFLGVAEPALTRLLAYTWPGNVRELRHVLEKAIRAARTGEGASSPFLQESHVAPFLP